MFAGLQLDVEQRALVATVQKFLATEAPLSTSRAWAPDGPENRALYDKLATHVGLAALLIDESQGGLGLGWVEACAVLEEAGAQVLGTPLLSTLLAGFAAQLAAGESTAAIASGESRAVLCLPDEGVADARLPRVADGQVHGRVDFVLDAAGADLLLVLCRTEDEHLVLADVEPAVGGTHSDSRQVLDATRDLATVSFEAAPARSVAPVSVATAQRLRDVRSLGFAAEAVGVARLCLMSARGYALERRQFGRPIGSFQAVKHLLASALVDVESARSIVRVAAASADEGSEDLSRHASAAKVWCSDAVSRVAATALQVHGGIGYTWEHDIQLAFKRATTLARLAGDADYHRRRTVHLYDL